MKNKTILLGLNELNFDYIKFYVNKGLLPSFKKIFEIQKPIETVSEKEYKLLEPWVQWVTIHSGKSYKEHNVFRLGDIVNNPELSQIFEELEAEGLSVGAVSPFNAENRLKNPSQFHRRASKPHRRHSLALRPFAEFPTPEQVPLAQSAQPSRSPEQTPMRSRP